MRASAKPSNSVGAERTKEIKMVLVLGRYGGLPGCSSVAIGRSEAAMWRASKI